jgi:hypothetical protein
MILFNATSLLFGASVQVVPIDTCPLVPYVTGELTESLRCFNLSV